MMGIRGRFAWMNAIRVIGIGILMGALVGCVPATRGGDPTSSVTATVPSIKMGDVCQYLIGFLQTDWVGTRQAVTTYDPDAFASTRVFGMSPPQASCTYISNPTNVAAAPPKEEPYYISLKVIQGSENNTPRPGWKSQSLSIDNAPIVISWQDNSEHDWRMATAVELSVADRGWSGHVNLPTLRSSDPLRGEPISEGDLRRAGEQLLTVVRKVAGSR